MPTIIAISGGRMAFSENGFSTDATGLEDVEADIDPCFLLNEREMVKIRGQNRYLTNQSSNYTIKVEV
ncbi:hypothetical protein OMP38_24810 [Cohnella ginsengisoli]|uniref:Uncharacterized protein n=1 Tax=Cohnella ginsengisoli TaxID=425004 RepID=A0A9X4KKR7_9BACL|nr:hypothetical protein [Cohnella ginsengisoli]MDG0793691.1 hypothetical protein [Cohnella ginsengisoli]